MLEYVVVHATEVPGIYFVEDDWGNLEFYGNAEQLHTFLANEGYSKADRQEGAEGWYRRAAAPSVVEGGRQA